MFSATIYFPFLNTEYCLIPRWENFSLRVLVMTPFSSLESSRAPVLQTLCWGPWIDLAVRQSLDFCKGLLMIGAGKVWKIIRLLINRIKFIWPSSQLYRCQNNPSQTRTSQRLKKYILRIISFFLWPKVSVFKNSQPEWWNCLFPSGTPTRMLCRLRKWLRACSGCFSPGSFHGWELPRRCCSSPRTPPQCRCQSPPLSPSSWWVISSHYHISNGKQNLTGFFNSLKFNL